eukprot:4605485-Amphidinium_carterae.1
MGWVRRGDGVGRMPNFSSHLISQRQRTCPPPCSSKVRLTTSGQWLRKRGHGSIVASRCCFSRCASSR